MTQALLITLREGLEISLLVVIVLAYLREARRGDLFRSVWYGVGLAAACSVAVGAVLFGVGTGLSGKAEQVFEGVAMFVAAAVLTWMIIWMKGQARLMRREIEVRVERAIARGSGIALASLAFVIVVREGLETALFLFSASKTATPAATTSVVYSVCSLPWQSAGPCIRAVAVSISRPFSMSPACCSSSSRRDCWLTASTSSRRRLPDGPWRPGLGHQRRSEREWDCRESVEGNPRVQRRPVRP